MNLRLPRSKLLSAVLFAASGMLTIPLAAQTPSSRDTETPVWTQANLPRWAYTGGFVSSPPQGSGKVSYHPLPGDNKAVHLAGSDVTCTEKQFHDPFDVCDWFPNDHPRMPHVVAHGRPPYVQACGTCHQPNGEGHPENASLAGLPEEYILRQLADFKDGFRKNSAPYMGSYFMIPIASALTAAEAEAAAKYFSSLKYTPWVRVVEADRVPVTRRVAQMLVPVPGGRTEPLGERIIEIPENPKLKAAHDYRSGYVAYVPKGSIERGKFIVQTGDNGKAVRCTLCHGMKLQGIGNVPYLAGRSPFYIVRQIIDIQNGTRHSPYALLMREPVRDLSLGDIIDVAAYLASLHP